jgi:hypothetical protein
MLVSPCLKPSFDRLTRLSEIRPLKSITSEVIGLAREVMKKVATLSGRRDSARHSQKS